MQSKSRASFHPPEVCYPAAGYDVEYEGYETILVPEEIWEVFEESYFYHPDTDPSRCTVRLKNLIISKEVDGEIVDRRMVLYFYVGDSSVFDPSNEITMVRVSAFSPPGQPEVIAFETASSFTIDLLPYLFTPDENEDEAVIKNLADKGAVGILIICVLFIIPVAIFFYPEIHNSIIGRKNRKADSESR